MKSLKETNERKETILHFLIQIFSIRQRDFSRHEISILAFLKFHFRFISVRAWTPLSSLDSVKMFLNLQFVNFGDFNEHFIQAINSEVPNFPFQLEIMTREQRDISKRYSQQFRSQVLRNLHPRLYYEVLRIQPQSHIHC